MTTVHEIEVELTTDAGEAHAAAPLLASKFAGNRTRNANVYRFADPDQLHAFVSFLQQHKIRFQRFYVFVLDKEEVRSYPAFYLGADVMFDLIVDNQVNPKKFKKHDIAFDYGSERLVVTPRVQELLELLAPGVVWRPIEASNGRPYAELTIASLLPDPIGVPHPTEVAEKETPRGTYAVRSDGRDVISAANASALEALGVARCEQVELPGQKTVTSPRRLVSGRVLDTLLVSRVKGLLLPPVPLLLLTHPAL